MPRRTTRQRESQKIAQEKARKRSRENWRRRLGLGSLLTLSSITLLTSWAAWKTGRIDMLQNAATNQFHAITVRAGFSVEQIYLDGREEVPLNTINEALEIKKGDPILAISVEKAREQLEAIPEIYSASVERSLPNAIHIAIEERKPAALWQHAGSYNLIDIEGHVLANEEHENAEGLLLVVGEDAPEHLEQLFSLLVKAPALKEEMEAAQRVGDRRWNLLLKNGITVKMPEENMEAAMSRLGKLIEADALLTKAISVIDLRLPDRLFLTPDHSIESTTPLASNRT